MRFAAETRIQHLIFRGRQVTALKNDVRDGWNGTKKSDELSQTRTTAFRG